MESIELKGKKCILFGANDPLGMNIIKHLLEMGIEPGLIDIDGKETNLDLPQETVIPGDEKTFKRAVDNLSAKFGKIDFLILSYYFEDKLKFFIDDPNLEKWDLIRERWVDSYFLCMKTIAPHFIKNKFGRVVFLNTLAGYTGEGEGEGELIVENSSIYECAASSAITGMMTSIARQIIPMGISVNGIAIRPNYMEDIERINDAIDLWLSGVLTYSCGQIIRIY